MLVPNTTILAGEAHMTQSMKTNVMKCLHSAILTSAILATPVLAENLRIGFITTLSGGGAALGVDIKDGFEHALNERGGKLGGLDVDLTIIDDTRKVEVAKQAATKLIKQDDVHIMTGMIWSNLTLAVVPGVLRADKIYISPNSGPSAFAGKRCDKNFFNVAWQNDNLHEAAGQYVNDLGVKRAYTIAPNYPGGKEAVTGFKRYFKGEIVGEVYTKLGQTDYAAEIANLRAAKPEGLFIFLPGGMGINFIKQFDQSGLNEEVKLFGSAFSFDEVTLQAVGKAALGVYNTAQYTYDLDNEANNAFVASFEKAYGRKPSLYVSQGYETALAIDAAVAKVGGNLENKDALRAAIKEADFASVRGKFRFANDQFPIQDIYVRQVVSNGDQVTNKTIGTVFKDHANAYTDQCGM